MMLCQFLMYNEVNQLYVYIYPLPLGPPSYPCRSSQSTRLSSLCYTAASHQLFVVHMVLCVCQCYSPNSSHPLFLSSCVHMSISYIGHLYTCPANMFIYTILQIPHICINIHTYIPIIYRKRLEKYAMNVNDSMEIMTGSFNLFPFMYFLNSLQ